MAAVQRWWAALLVAVLHLVAGEASAAAPPHPAVCPRPTATAAFLGAPGTCSLPRPDPVHRFGAIEGNEVTFAWAIDFLHRYKGTYIAVLLYASWCPFSQQCRPRFEELGYLFPTILHLAFEESKMDPSTISTLGIHGYPVLYIMNSTMRMQYHGPRTIKSLAAFYSDVSGINASSDSTIGDFVPIKLKKNAEQENCPFSLSCLQEKLRQQDTYLALAVSFLILRLLYLLCPKIATFARWIWRRHTLIANLTSVPECLFSYLEQGRLKFNKIYPSKGVNLHDGARNASAWASKSLASVSIAEPSMVG
ncbi:hypothetical protein ACP70R_042558 [Stipagrostis hirtigluma subsp. patula]